MAKPITGAATSHLIDTTTLGIEDQVFGGGGVLGDLFPSNILLNQDKYHEIKVADLLEHTLSGWGSECQGPHPDEPGMFRVDPELSRDQLIGHVLTKLKDTKHNYWKFRI